MYLYVMFDEVDLNKEFVCDVLIFGDVKFIF